MKIKLELFEMNVRHVSTQAFKLDVIEQLCAGAGRARIA